MRYVYILRCQDESLYIGESDELKARRDDHPDVAERLLFVRWFMRLGFAPVRGTYWPKEALWPWTRGWTEELIDAYVTKPAHREAA